MEKDILEEIRCPICFEVPPNEILQCKDGHTVCSNCSQSILDCPQCRVPFDDSKIRNRALESIRDIIKTNKKLEKSIKVTKPKKKISTTASQNWSFSKSNGFPQNICENLGYDCEFLISDSNLPEALVHFKEEHEFIVCSESSANISLEGLDHISQQHQSIWSPIILNQEFQRGLILLLFAAFNKKDKSVSLHCIKLNSDDDQAATHDYRAEFLISAVDRNEAPDLTWNSTPVSLRHSTNVIKHPVFRIPSKIISNYVKDGSISVQFSLQPTTSLQAVLSTEKVYTFNIPCHESTQLVSKHDASSPISTPPTQRRIYRSRNRRDSLASIQFNQSSSSSARSSRSSSTSLAQNNTVSQQTIFNNVDCYFCNGAIIGTLYKCLQCEDNVLCEQCFGRTHKHHIFAMIRNKEQNDLFNWALSSFRFATSYLPETLRSSVEPEINLSGKPSYWCVEQCSPEQKSKCVYICLQCNPICGYCEDCFIRCEQDHYADHYFAVVDTERKLNTLVEYLLIYQ